LACECPTKLFYANKEREYGDQSTDDSFLRALADGGFQVGELAKCYYPDGHDITAFDEEALAQTNALLEQENVVIFEAAVRVDNLFIRIDILKKEGNHFKLIEVKAKSWSGENLVSAEGKIAQKWRPYLEDVAFQKYVLERTFPESTVSTSLMLVNKKACCTVNGLNQKFKVVQADGQQKGIAVSNTLSEDDLRDPILFEVCTDISCAVLFEEFDDAMGMGFKEKVQAFSNAYARDEPMVSKIGRQCNACQFKTSDDGEANGLKSGLKECWRERAEWSEADFSDPSILEIWNLNYKKRDKLFSEGRLKIKDVGQDDIALKTDSEPGITVSERQWLQVEKVRNRDDSVWLDAPALRVEMDSWEFPLNFIDFETAAPAIPFHKGLFPYEGIAFQFSHHTVSSDGTVAHVNEYLNGNPGEFPNYDFLRVLKAKLEANSGTIFRYSNHENTYLNMIVAQLAAEPDGAVPDRDVLTIFAHQITQGKKSSDRPAGERNMIDLCELVKRFYYAPSTKGSNSIKAVLPAILNSSDFLKIKYAQPLYGAADGIPSLNFKDWAWVDFESDGTTVVDPYKRLPPIFPEMTAEEIERLDLLFNERDLQDGGAAMIAYAKLQFTDMSKVERQQVEQSLLRYCELDTLAMVMIYEGWRAMLDDCFSGDAS